MIFEEASFSPQWWSNVRFILLVHSCSPALSCCNLGMQDGKQSVKSRAVCMCWSASKMSSKTLNSWVVPIWPQVWVLIWSAAGFSLGNVTSELRNQPNTRYDFVKICKCIPSLSGAERRDRRQRSHVQVINIKNNNPKPNNNKKTLEKTMLACFQQWVLILKMFISCRPYFSCNSELVNAYILPTSGIKIV